MTRTLPVESRMAECPPRGVLKLPVALNVPVTGSYNSALASAPAYP